MHAEFHDPLVSVVAEPKCDIGTGRRITRDERRQARTRLESS